MSVLRIYQNPIAINALRNLSVTSSSISKSLERLSSGLRINRAADDAAGLSISEKLRAQIRGLNRASANALDGISLIQTAEGALNEVHSILQRMRELAVQAANGIYTATDRAALQLEVSQLIDEVNRISSSTEFNTKKLLDGTLGALVSTDDYSKVSAAVTGNVGNGGNFVMKAVAKTTGQLQVYKTDVFATTMETDAVGQINYLNTWRAGATVASAGPDGIGNTGIYQVEVPISANGSVAVNSNTDCVINVFSVVQSGGGSTVGQNLQAEELSVGDRILITLQGASLGVQTFSVAINDLAWDNDGLASVVNLALGDAAGPWLSSACVYNTGRFSLHLNASVTVLNTQFIDNDESGSDFYVSFDSTGSSNYFFTSFSVSFTNNGASAAGSFSRAAGNAGRAWTMGTPATGQFQFRFDVRHDFAQVSIGATAATGAQYTDTIAWSRYGGGNSLQDYGRVWQEGPAAANGTYVVSAITFRTYAVFSFDNGQYTDLVAAGIDQDIAMASSRGSRLTDIAGNNEFSLAQTFVGATGSSLENVRMTFDGILQAGETATFNVSTNNVLTGDQLNTLASLNRFQEFGVFLGRNNVELTVYQRGTDRSTTINISKNDTFEELANKISLAIWNPLDGSGVINSGILNGQFPPDLVHVNTIGVAKGTMSITSPMPGAEVIFAGDEALLNALSMVEIRDSVAPVYSVTAFNLEKGASVGSVITDSNEITGLLPGLRIFFDNTLGLRLDPEPPTELAGGSTNASTSFAYPLPTSRPHISLSGEIESFFIHVAPREFSLQVGANQGQTISGIIADHSAKALGVEGLLITESELAQESISIIDVAISRVSDMRSRLGAIQNRLESTIRNIDIASENLTAAESRIRDADVAKETLTMTRNQILLQAGVAALAQANQLPQTVLQLLQ